jgi:hypothetical protein
MITLAEAMRDTRLLGAPFEAPSFWTWFTIAKLLSGEQLDDREQALFAECTGRSRVPSNVRRMVILAGRRAGKDRFLSAVAVHASALCSHKLSAGELGVVLMIGADRKQAAIMRRYARGLCDVPLIRSQVVRETLEGLEFANGTSFEVSTNDARLIRGRSAIAVLGSEACHWKTDEDNASSDVEVIAAAEPSLALTPGGGLMILASSPYRKAGALFNRWRDYFGRDDAEVMVWQAPSRVMNETIPQEIIDNAMRDDPARAKSEYLAEWREDLSDFVPSEVIEGCTEWTCHERPFDPRFKYCAFTDAAGGTGSDSFTLAVAHRETDGRAVLDVLRERRPRFVPAHVVSEFADLLHRYHCREVTGDRFSGGWCASEFQAHRINYRPSALSKSELYLAVLPMLSAGDAVLLDDERLRRQLSELERRAHAGNRESVDRRANLPDDLANVACGALVLTAQRTGRAIIGYGNCYGGPIRWETDEPKRPRFKIISGGVTP